MQDLIIALLLPFFFPTLTPISHTSVVIEGIASYYSDAGCVGCRDDRIMANGEVFDESAMTLAMNDLPLDTSVLVINSSTGESRRARVTDTGGFSTLGRIADLSLGLKEAINCTDLCEVHIRPLTTSL